MSEQKLAPAGALASDRRLAIGVGAALVSAVAYGINIVYARKATLEGAAPADLVFLRIVLMALAAGLALRLGFGIARVAPAGRPWLIGLVLTTAGVGLSYFFAVSYLPIGVAAIVFYTFPLVILIASPFVDGEKFTLFRAGVFTVAFLGLAIALGPGIEGIDPRGLILVGVASLLAATQFFQAARAGALMDQMALLFWVHLLVAPIVLAVALANGGPSAGGLAGAWGAVSVTALGYLVGYALQMYAAKHAPPAAIGLVFCLEPVVSIAVAGLVLGESLSASQYVGGSIVLAALVASSLMELRRGAAKG